QLSAIYLWGVENKLAQGFLSGEKLESQMLFYVFDSDPPQIPAFRMLMASASFATIALELALAIGLWFRRARGPLVILGMGFHLLIYLTLPVITFSITTCLVYLAYFDPDDVHRAIDRISEPLAMPVEGESADASSESEDDSEVEERAGV